MATTHFKIGILFIVFLNFIWQGIFYRVHSCASFSLHRCSPLVWHWVFRQCWRLIIILNNLHEENFIDIKAHRFRKALEYQWYDNISAWCITGASLDGDLAFVQNELKLQSELSEYVNVRLEIEQEVFYADGEFPLPTTEIYPWAGDLGLYIGQVEERQNYLRDNSRNTINDSVEAKFRMGFEYSSSDGRSSLQFNLSLNADDPFNDPGDGGGISFQSVFW